MERKIGEIFEFCGKWYQCLKSDGSCADCAFLSSFLCGSINDKGICRHDLRKDATNVIFKKLEKIGETYQYMDGIYQQYKATLPFFIKDATYIETTNGFAIKQNKEDMNKLNLKPFDLEEAKAGKAVYTRDGRKVRILCFDATRKDKKKIITLVPSKNYPGFEDLISYPDNGNYYGGHENDGDLMMFPEKKEGWVNIYKGSVCISVYPRIYKSREEAVSDNTAVNRIDTVKISWEE